MPEHWAAVRPRPLTLPLPPPPPSSSSPPPTPPPRSSLPWPRSGAVRVHRSFSRQTSAAQTATAVGSSAPVAAVWHVCGRPAAVVSEDYGVTGGDAKRTLCVVARWCMARPYCAGGAAANAAKRRADALPHATHPPPLVNHLRGTSAPRSMGFPGRHARVRVARSRHLPRTIALIRPYSSTAAAARREFQCGQLRGHRYKPCLDV